MIYCVYCKSISLSCLCSPRSLIVGNIFIMIIGLNYYLYSGSVQLDWESMTSEKITPTVVIWNIEHHRKICVCKLITKTAYVNLELLQPKSLCCGRRTSPCTRKTTRHRKNIADSGSMWICWHRIMSWARYWTNICQRTCQFIVTLVSLWCQPGSLLCVCYIDLWR